MHIYYKQCSQLEDNYKYQHSEYSTLPSTQYLIGITQNMKIIFIKKEDISNQLCNRETHHMYVHKLLKL